MDNQKNLELIRQKCIESNPEIMELKFGCKVTFNRGHGKETGMYLYHVEGFCDVIYPNDYQYGIYQVTNPKLKILGREIQLADVLLVMKDRGIVAAVSASGQIDVSPFKGDTHWDLTKPLSGQSPETLEFISNLLNT